MSAADDCGRPKSCKMCGIALRVSNNRGGVFDPSDRDDAVVLLLDGLAVCIVSCGFGGDAEERGVGAGTGIISFFNGT